MLAKIAGLSNRTVFYGKANNSGELIQFICCDNNFLGDLTLIHTVCKLQQFNIQFNII